MTDARNAPSGLRAEFNRNGSLRRFDCGAVSLALFVGNEMEDGPTNLYLRLREPPYAWTALLGPGSPTQLGADGIGTGVWRDIRYAISLVLARGAPRWFWQVRLLNTETAARSVELTYVQDLALAPYGAVRMNEFYVSQYIDHAPLTHEQLGTVIASRQNQAVDGRYPWSLIGSLRRAVAFGTDALQFYGLSGRAGSAPPGLVGALSSQRLQHEHSMVVLQDQPLSLEPGREQGAGFFGVYEPDHPAATATADLERIDAVLRLPEASLASGLTAAAAAAAAAADRAGATARSLFGSAPLLESAEWDDAALEARFARPWRALETDERGTLSFFHGRDCHLITRAKELSVLRPHGHMLRSGLHLTPDETALTSTVWMTGVFHSMLTQGHVSINRVFSSVHGYLGLFRSHGVRVFVELDGAWRLLQLPSAFEISPHRCRWFYGLHQGEIEVRAEACEEPCELELSVIVRGRAPLRLLLSHHVALNGDDGSQPGPTIWRREGNDIVLSAVADSDVGRRFPNGGFRIRSTGKQPIERVGGDEMLFADEQSRQQPYLCLRTRATDGLTVRYRGEFIAEASPRPLTVARTEELMPSLRLYPAAAGAAAERVERLGEIVPWFTHNAFVHYLSPRGLEQYSGGGWGTRDVCQGPVELLLALDRPQPVRDLLLRVMAAQNPDGDWPQWFMFFERERGIRAGDSHGDIVFWPLLVLAQYLIASGDAGLLDEPVRFFDSRGEQAGETASVWQHAQRSLALVASRVIPGTQLAAYGHGDWNDALQPADPRLREHLCSAWTVTLHFQMLTLLAQALRRIGRPSEAEALERSAADVRGEFQRWLLVDGVLAGYALFEGGSVRHLLHPSDSTTGVHYSALAMIHAILEDLFTPAQAQQHLRLIEAHLHGPDGLRLFDRPMLYHGGPQRLFQRAESATFFGREIGLMYMHAHLRYAQALAHLGESERFFQALCQANPIGIRSVVPSASLRQSNCYYSSSDAAFADRYQASAQYHRVVQGTIALDGGWRVYSSGAGISLGLIMRRFLGLSFEAHDLCLDPVIAPGLDGLRAQLSLRGRSLEIQYRVGKRGAGVAGLRLNGQALAVAYDPNPHRRGAARTSLAAVLERLNATGNRLEVSLD